MAKSKIVSTIKVVDVVNKTEFSYLADSEPKKGTVGNSYSGTLAAQGVAKLQNKDHTQALLNAMGTMYNFIKANGMPILNNGKDWCAFLRTTLALNGQELGTRGEQWDSTEQRNLYKVFVDDVEYNPPFTKGQIKKMNAEQVVQEQVISEIVVPQIVSASADISPIPNIPVAQPVAQMPIPQVIAPQPIVPIPATQPLPQGNFDKYIDRITTLVADGKYNKEQIIGGLAKKVGQDKAVELYNLVTRVNSIPAF